MYTGRMGLSFYRKQTELAERCKQSEETELWKFLQFHELLGFALLSSLDY